MQPTLPGIRFINETVRSDRTLPRMDVAGFAGFASAGPVGIPVPVEDAVQLEEIFGPDLPLAWDAGARRPLIAHLTPSASHFFRQGGRRCWITREAGEGKVIHAFALPGLAAFRPSEDHPVLPALARARSPGAWPEGWLASTRLSREVILPSRGRFRFSLREGNLQVTGDGAEVLGSFETIRFVPTGGSLPGLSPPEQSPPGQGPSGTGIECILSLGRRDRLEPSFSAATFAFLEAEAEWPEGFPPATMDWVDGQGRAVPLPVESWEPFLAEVDFSALKERGLEGWHPAPGTIVAFAGEGRILLAQIGSVQTVEDAGSPPGARVRLGLRRLWWLLQAADLADLDGLEGEAPYLERFTLEVTVREPARERSWSLAGLGLSDQGSSWSNLPMDDVLFPAPDAPVETRISDDLRGLYERARHPRFPLAGPASPSPLYLPLGMDEGEPEFRTPPLGRWDATRSIEREGLASFHPDMLLDLDLLGGSRESAGGLLEAKATQARYVGGTAGLSAPGGRPLRGIHSFYFLDEVTLLAAPDAVQPGWDRISTGQNLDVPHLDAPEIIEIIGEGLARTVRWTGVDGAKVWELQVAGDPDFARPLVEDRLPVSGDPTLPASADILLPSACPRLVYFRVRALGGTGDAGPGGQEGDAGRMSPWSATWVRRAPVPVFSRRDVVVPVAPWLSLDADGRLVWTAPSGEILFRAEEDSRPDFPGPFTLHCGEALPLELEPRPEWRYLRVRSEGPLPGPWSNTVAVPPVPVSSWSARAAEDFRSADGGPALARFHLAQLRLCESRGDILAALSLPLHYAWPQAEAHARFLARGLNDRSLAGSAPGGILGYGALQHPWVLEEARPAILLPPDGMACGMMAHMALRRGAWISPANRPLAGSLALGEDLGEAARLRLLAVGVNALIKEPQGILLEAAHTLSDDPEAHAVNVRRLMHLVRRLALREGNRLAFENHDHQTRRAVARIFQEAMGKLFRLGAFAGATGEESFQVVVDETVNPRQSVEQGRLMVELRIAPSQPLTFLTVRLLQLGEGRIRTEEA